MVNKNKQMSYITKGAMGAMMLLLVAGAKAQVTPPATPVVNEFSVRQAVDYAKKNSIRVKNALLDIRMQQEKNREITSQALPQLSGSGTFNDYLKIPTNLLPAEIAGGPAGTYIPVQFGTKYNVTGGFDASQILFDGQVFVGLQARKTSIDFYSKISDITVEMINLNVQKIYYQLVVGKEQIEKIDANIERSQKLYSDTKAMFDQGFKERLDVDKAQVQLNNLQTEKIKAQNQLDAGYAGLKFLMNMPQKEKLVLTDTLSEDKIKSDLLVTDYNYKDRNEFQLLELQKKLNEYNVRRYKLSYIPTLSAFGSYQKNAQRTSFDFFKGGDNRQWFTTALIGVKLSVPIFDGFAKRSRVNQAKIDLQKTENSIQNMKDSIDYDVVQANQKITAALLTMDNQKRNMELAEKVYNTTRIKYDQGLGDNLEVYNAQADLKVAQNDYYSAVYDAIVAKLDYQKAIGKLQ